MSRLQQWILLILTTLIMAGLVAGVYMKKHPHAASDAGAVQTASSGTENSATASATLHVVKPMTQQEIIHAVPNRPATPVHVTPPPPRPANWADGYDPANNARVQAVMGQMRLLGATISSAVVHKRMTFDDFEKLTFGGADSGGDPEYNVFNPEGRVRFKPLLDQWIQQSDLDALTTEAGTQFFYNLRRTVDAKGTITDVLYAVLPKPTVLVCNMTHLIMNGTQLTFPADNSKVVQDAADAIPKNVYTSPACLVMADKKTYWFVPLRLRTKRAGEQVWGSY